MGLTNHPWAGNVLRGAAVQRERLTWLRVMALSADGLALAAAWVGLSWLRVAAEPLLPWLSHAAPSAYLPLVGLIAPAWLVALWWQGSYRYLRRKAWGTILSELCMASLVARVGVLALLYLLKVTWISRAVLLGFSILSVPTLALSRWLDLWVLRTLRRSRFDPSHILLVGSPADAQPLLQVLAEHPEWAIQPVGWLGTPPAPEETAPALPYLGTAATLAHHLTEQPIDEVLLVGAVPELGALSGLAAVCEELGVPLAMDANFLGLRAARAEVQDFEGWTTLRFTTAPTPGLAWLLKRVMDATVAALGLLLCAPLLLLIALLVKLGDGGPVLFVQQRAGLHGRPFPMLKFRTMVPDAEARLATLAHQNEMSGPVFKMARDPRVTGVGRWLRRTSLDELPQLYNVLVGQMSLVGPRPPLPAEVRRYARWQLRRLSVRPGITCIWQVSGRSNIDFDRWMALDLQYIDSWSLWLDLRILLQTVPAVLRGTGAR